MFLQKRKHFANLAMSLSQNHILCIVILDHTGLFQAKHCFFFSFNLMLQKLLHNI